MKGEETLSIDLSHKSDVASYMIISSGGSTTKVGAMAQEVRKDLKALGAEILNVDGTGNKDWVLIDANDCVVHLFRPPVRAFYNLERLWAPENEWTPFNKQPEDEGDHPLSLEPEVVSLEDEHPLKLHLICVGKMKAGAAQRLRSIKNSSSAVVAPFS